MMHPPQINVTTTCATYAMGSALDYGTTTYALGHGGNELNPAQQTGGARIAWAAVTTAGGCGIDVALQRKGHPRLAKTLRIVALAVKIGLAVHNVRAVR